MTEDAFIKLYQPYAEEVQSKYGVPAASCLAQAALESGWGKTTPGNMMFGIKADSSWTGAKQYLWTWEQVKGKMVHVQSYFRKYNSIRDSFLDYGKFLKNNRRYASCFRTKDPDTFSNLVAGNGYATSGKYWTALKGILAIIKKKYRPSKLTISAIIAIAGGIIIGTILWKRKK